MSVPTKKVSEILTEEGVKALADFCDKYRQGKYAANDTIARHVILRDCLKPHLRDPENNDPDYIAYAIAYVLGIT